jgi:hypothetical protein
LAAKARRLYSNFSKGELSPLLDGRPDLAGYFEGGRTALNWYLLRQGGLVRRPGTRFVQRAKFSTKDTVFISFEFSVDDAFILEFGDLYIRFFKNDVAIESSPGVPYEIVSPYEEANLRTIHVEQSADVLFIFHPLYQQRRLSRIADTNWVILPISYRPPPSFEADTDISDDTPGSPISPPNPPVDVPPPGEVPPDGGQPVIPPTDTSGGGSGGE